MWWHAGVSCTANDYCDRWQRRCIGVSINYRAVQALKETLKFTLHEGDSSIGMQLYIHRKDKWWWCTLTHYPQAQHIVWATSYLEGLMPKFVPASIASIAPVLFLHPRSGRFILVYQ